MSLQILNRTNTRGVVESEAGLVLPPEVRRNVLGVCRVPVGDGRVCGAVFFRGQQSLMDLHIVGNGDVVGCLQRNAEHIEAERKSVKRPYELAQDTELKAWVDMHTDALISGRMRM